MGVRHETKVRGLESPLVPLSKKTYKEPIMMYIFVVHTYYYLFVLFVYVYMYLYIFMRVYVICVYIHTCVYVYIEDFSCFKIVMFIEIKKVRASMSHNIPNINKLVRYNNL